MFLLLLQEQFPGFDPSNWTFAKELKKARKLGVADKKPDDPKFVFEETPPPDMEKHMFPTMTRIGTPVYTMEQARALVDDLKKSGVSKPRLPQSVWDVSSHYIND